MKQTTTKLVLAGILMSTSVFAQNNLPGLENRTTSGPGVPPVAKSTALATRVIAAAGYNYSNGFSYQLEDTAFLTYSGDRGSDSAFTSLKYDVLVAQEMVSNVLTNDGKQTQTFDVNDNILTTLIQDWNVGTSSWENDMNSVYTYDGNNRMLSHIQQNWNAGTMAWDNTQRTLYNYDMNGNVLTIIYQNWDAGTMAWVNNTQDIYTYNTNNDITVHVFQNWNTGLSAWVNDTKVTNTYDSNNDMTTSLEQNWNVGTSSWDNYVRHTYSYDANHHMLTDARQTWVVAVWQNSMLTTNVYTGDELTTSTRQQWNNGTSSWDNSGKSLYTYDANHNQLSDIEQAWNSGSSTWENVSRQQRTYNSFNNFTSIWYDHWNAGIWQVLTTDMKYYYYYETYNTAGVEQVATVADFSLYPVPAQNYVRIEKAWSEPQAFTVSITDMQGRMIRSYSEKATANYSRNIDVNQLPAGNYVIKIAGVNGKASYQQFTVVR